jgi:hypothetical protein
MEMSSGMKTSGISLLLLFVLGSTCSSQSHKSFQYKNLICKNTNIVDESRGGSLSEFVISAVDWTNGVIVSAEQNQEYVYYRRLDNSKILKVVDLTVLNNLLIDYLSKKPEIRQELHIPEGEYISRSEATEERFEQIQNQVEAISVDEIGVVHTVCVIGLYVNSGNKDVLGRVRATFDITSTDSICRFESVPSDSDGFTDRVLGVSGTGVSLALLRIPVKALRKQSESIDEYDCVRIYKMDSKQSRDYVKTTVPRINSKVAPGVVWQDEYASFIVVDKGIIVTENEIERKIRGMTEAFDKIGDLTRIMDARYYHDTLAVAVYTKKDKELDISVLSIVGDNLVSIHQLEARRQIYISSELGPDGMFVVWAKDGETIRQYTCQVQ